MAGTWFRGSKKMIEITWNMSSLAYACAPARTLHLNHCDLIKRKSFSKWKNPWSDKVYFEADFLEERCFDALLNTKMKSKLRRRRTFKNLLTHLLLKERVVTTYGKAMALSRLANRTIDVAKEGNEPLLYSWMTRKELIPRIYEDLMPRYEGPIGGQYTQVFRIESVKDYHCKGDAVVEFLNNGLPPLVPTEEELKKLAVERYVSDNKDQEHLQEGTTL